MKWVIDCSFYSALFLPDRSSAKVRKFFNSFDEKESFFVPALWWYELSNVLTLAERYNRIRRIDIDRIIELTGEFNIETDINIDKDYINDIVHLSSLHNLSAYDTAYLELAIRNKCGLASLDEQLIKGAKKSGVNIV